VFKFEGNWAGATGHTINPKSGSNPFDIITPLFDRILPETVTATANGGPQVVTTGCNDIASQNVERCTFIARDLLPNGCTSGQPVIVVVRGQVLLEIDGPDRRVKFESRDNPTCQ
jgi:hypothetical protein